LTVRLRQNKKNTFVCFHTVVTVNKTVTILSRISVKQTDAVLTQGNWPQYYQLKATFQTPGSRQAVKLGTGEKCTLRILSFQATPCYQVFSDSEPDLEAIQDSRDHSSSGRAKSA
jgi:hypothetical protein